MVRSLWNAATGMNGQQMNIDTISNNLSNVNTTGFKQHRAEFEDLIYQNVKLAGTPATEDTVTPVGHQMGSGVKVGATQRIMSQGSLQATGVDTDIAIVGDGFFRVQQYDGSWAYTRDGSFKVDSTGQLVNANGLRLQPEIIMPEGFQLETLSISDTGRVNVKVNGQLDPIEMDRLNFTDSQTVLVLKIQETTSTRLQMHLVKQLPLVQVRTEWVSLSTSSLK